MRDFDRVGGDVVNHTPVADEQALIDKVTDQRKRCFGKRIEVFDSAPRLAIRVVQLHKGRNQGGASQSFQFGTLVRQGRIALGLSKCCIDGALDCALQATQVIGVFPRESAFLRRGAGAKAAPA